MDKVLRCPICGEGNLLTRKHQRDSELDGYKFVVSSLLHSVCDHCGERVTTPDQSRHNKKVLVDSRARAVAERDRSQALQGSDVLRIRKKLGLTQAQAFRVFGGGTNAFSKYENGEVVPSDAMERLLRLADSVPVAATWLMRRGGAIPELAENPGRKIKPAFLSAVERFRKEQRGLILSSWGAVSKSIHMSYLEAITQGQQFTYASPEAANDPEIADKAELASYG